MALRSDNQTVGIILIVVGLVALAGWLTDALVLVAAIGAIVFGILVLMGKARGSQLVGGICLVAGILLLFGWLPFAHALANVLVTVAGIVLVVVGILKLMGKM